MIARILFFVSGFLPCQLIDRGPGQRYLERYFLFRMPTTGRMFYLHRFVDGDGDDALHDHPASRSISLVLTGGYWERRMKACGPDEVACPEYRIFPMSVETRKVPRYSLNRIGGGDFRQIIKIKPETWTLFSHTPHVKRWGFAKLITIHRRMNPANGLTTENFRYIWEPFTSASYQKKWWKKVLPGRKADRAPFNYSKV